MELTVLSLPCASRRKSFGKLAENQLSMLANPGSLLQSIQGRAVRMKIWIPQSGQLLTACEQGQGQAAGP